MTGLDAVLALCPASDERQRDQLRRRWRLKGLRDLEGAVIFGAAQLGGALARSLAEKGLRPAGFSDNDAARWGGVFEGLPVLAPGALGADRPVVIASKYVKEIYAGLRNRGLRLVPHYLLPLLFPDDFPAGYHSLSAEAVAAGREQIRSVYSLLVDSDSRELFLKLLAFRISLDPLDLPDPTPGQYFPGDFWRLSPREVFVDVGACGGDTLAEFLRQTGGVFDRYFAIEPDRKNLEDLGRAIPAGLRERIVVVPCGAGERRERVCFAADRGGESRVAADGPAAIEIVSLDELLAAEAVSTIKIDVEGYEREVLRGARETIRRDRPKLAVSVYHALRDLWELPAWIRDCSPHYRYHLRHHTPEIYDTVLYCVPDAERGAGSVASEAPSRVGRP